jgi:ATP-dependent RNA helicase TDRD9
VAEDRREAVGNTVGYAVSTERRAGPNTRVLYATAGTLQQHIVHQQTLDPFTHVILDEVHEREVEVHCRTPRWRPCCSELGV